MMGHLGMVICLPYFQFVSPPIGGLTLGPIFMCVLMCLCFVATYKYEIHRMLSLILVELHKKSNWFNIRSMFFSKPLYPIGGTMSYSLRRYMVCYYLATLFVLSLDSNTSGLHVNLLVGWTYIGGAGQD